MDTVVKKSTVPKSGKTAPKILSEKDIKFLSSIGCTMKEMAAFFDCSVDTLENKYSAIIASGREHGKASVRRIMWEQAKKGNSTALKYLVTNILKERVEEKADVYVENTFQGSPIDKELAEKILAAAEKMNIHRDKIFTIPTIRGTRKEKESKEDESK
jgi:hypothetical protein